jgi:integrase
MQVARPQVGEEDVRVIDLLNNRRMVQGAQTIGQVWQQWKKQAGLPRDLRIHDLRRDAAHRAYEVCKDVREVQGMLGHERPVSTLHYLHQAAPQVKTTTINQSLITEAP